jgi:hypothetical protein
MGQSAMFEGQVAAFAHCCIRRQYDLSPLQLPKKKFLNIL